MWLRNTAVRDTQFEYHLPTAYRISGSRISKGAAKWKIVQIRYIQQRDVQNEILSLLQKKEKAFAVPTAAQINAQRNFLCVFFEKKTKADALCGLFLWQHLDTLAEYETRLTKSRPPPYRSIRTYMKLRLCTVKSLHSCSAILHHYCRWDRFNTAWNAKWPHFDLSRAIIVAKFVCLKVNKQQCKSI